MAEPAKLKFDFDDYAFYSYNEIYGSAAPKKQPEPEYRSSPQPEYRSKPKPELDIVRPEKPRIDMLKLNEWKTLPYILRGMAIIVAMVMLIAVNVAAIVNSDAALYRIEELENELELKKGIRTELEVQLNSLVSMDKVEIVAVEQLGLIKLDSSDWEYINIGSENSVVSSQGITKQSD